MGCSEVWTEKLFVKVVPTSLGALMHTYNTSYSGGSQIQGEPGQLNLARPCLGMERLGIQLGGKALWALTPRLISGVQKKRKVVPVGVDRYAPGQVGALVREQGVCVLCALTWFCPAGDPCCALLFLRNKSRCEQKRC